MELFKKTNQGSAVGIVKHIEAADKNVESANNALENKFEKRNISVAASTYEELWRLNEWAYIARTDKTKGELDKNKNKIVRDIAQISALKGVELAYVRAVSCYSKSIGDQLREDKLSLTTIRNMIKAQIQRFEVEKQAFNKLNDIPAELLFDKESKIGYEINRYAWDPKGNVMKWDEITYHTYTPQIRNPLRRSLKEIETDIQNTEYTLNGLDKLGVKQVLSMLEDHFDVKLNGAKQRSIKIIDSI